MKAHAVKSTIVGLLEAVGRQTTALITHLSSIKLVLKRLAVDISKSGADLWAQVVAAEQFLSAEKDHVECLERERATKFEREQ